MSDFSPGLFGDWLGRQATRCIISQMGQNVFQELQEGKGKPGQ
jgi:hypothetical protein